MDNMDNCECTRDETIVAVELPSGQKVECAVADLLLIDRAKRLMDRSNKLKARLRQYVSWIMIMMESGIDSVLCDEVDSDLANIVDSPSRLRILESFADMIHGVGRALSELRAADGTFNDAGVPKAREHIRGLIYILRE